jgi:hypothetical protein
MLDINDEIIIEVGSGTNNESSLHSLLKKWYALPGDRLEARVEGYIIDIIREDLLIEIQTGNFKAIYLKLEKLLKNNKVKVVYPIPEEKWIVKVSEENEVISRRKSPKRGQLIDIFDELIRIPQLINNENFFLEAVLVTLEEIRCDNGKGSWRRKGVSVVDRKLVDVNGRFIFNNPLDFICFLPEDIGQAFTCRDISTKCGIAINKARKIAYCLKKSGIINVCGKNRNELIYEISKTI